MSATLSPPRLYLCPELAGTYLTADEFDSADGDERYNYELIHGVLIVTPPVAVGERGPNDELGYLLRIYRDSHPNGASLDLTLPESYVCGTDHRRRTDRAIWAGLGRTPNVQCDVPTIAVEFVSASRRDMRRDYLAKREEYMAAGVKEYWIIDRFARQMTVVRPDESDPHGRDVLVPASQDYSTPLLSGFVLPLSQLFGIADRLEQASHEENH